MKFLTYILYMLQTLSVYNQMRPREHKSLRRGCSSLSESSPCECQESAEGVKLTCSAVSQSEVVKLVGDLRPVVLGLRLTRLGTDLTSLPYWILANTSLHSLHIQSTYIKEVDENFFQGMESSLQTLEISDSWLTYVPRGINKIGSLRDLSLSGNNITELYPYSFYGASLSSLNLGGNYLTSLSDNSFLGLEGNLHTLDLNRNRFTKFPMIALKNLQGLRTVSLVGNSIEAMPDEEGEGGMNSMESLNLKSNLFQILNSSSFVVFTGLKTLDLSSNQISEVEIGAFHKLGKLVTLSLAENKLTSLPPGLFMHNTNLESLDLSFNHLRHVSGLVTGLPSLVDLRLQYNYILAISDDTFEKSGEIRHLHLEHNVIYEVGDNAFQSLKKLRELRLEFNFLSKISESLLRRNLALNILYLDNNQIRSIDTKAFTGVPKLEKLTLHQNSLKVVEKDLLSGLTSLQELSLEQNKITTIHAHAFSSLSSLQYLNLSSNKLANLDDIMMRYPSSLSSLYITDNKIISFNEATFSGQTTLELIMLGNNKIESITEKLFAELINLFRLNLQNNRIDRIDDGALGHCVQLRFLDLSFNRILEIGSGTLAGLNQLEEMDLSNNKLESIERGAFQSLHHLKLLNLAGNKLATIGEAAFLGCHGVQTLILHSSMVTQIQAGAFKPFTSLTHIDLRHNSISDILSWMEMENLPRVKTFQFSGNNLHNISALISLGKLPSLEQVELENCNISSLSSSLISTNKNLKIIKLGKNLISHLPPEFFSKQVFLQSLSLDMNQFNTVPGDSLRYLFNLKELNLSSNLLTELTDSSFDEVTGLTSLDISDNRIQTFSHRCFHNATRLKVLNLGGNLVSEFPSTTFLPLTSLHTIAVDRNQLNYIPIALQGLRNVTHMRLGHNPLVRFREMSSSSGSMSTLHHLHITGTSMTELDETDITLCPNLLSLNLSSNQISIIRPGAFKSQKDLVKLDLRLNQLIRLPGPSLQGLVSLEYLNLRENELGRLDEFSSDLRNIKILDLSGNQITSIESRVFQSLGSLLKLDLARNRIAQIDQLVFQNTVHLKSLDMRSNLLDKVPVDAFSVLEHSLESLHFEDNPLVCSCRTYRHKLWFRQNRKWMDLNKRSSKVGPQCMKPENLAERHLLTIKDSELCPLPSVNSFHVRNVTTNSVLIAWDSKDSNMTGLKGFLVAYHRLDQNDVVKKYKVNPTTRMFRLYNLMDDSVYLVCIITQGSSYTDYDYVDDYGELLRLERDVDDTLELDIPYSDQRVLSYEEEEGFDLGGGPGSDLEIPSSNDTRYLILKPTILNLDSKSSRCNKIKTPLDPNKVKMIDNKQLSAVIGCSSGLMIFFCIIISIIVAKPKRADDEDEVIVPKSSSLSDSYKSPSTKSRNGSLGPNYDKASSQTSSLNKLNGTEIRKGDTGTLQRRPPGSRQASPSRRNLDKPVSPAARSLEQGRSVDTGRRSLRKGLSKQSSTESGPPSHKLSRQGSETSQTLRRLGNRQSSEYLNAPRGKPGQSRSPHLGLNQDLDFRERSSEQEPRLFEQDVHSDDIGRISRMQDGSTSLPRTGPRRPVGRRGMGDRFSGTLPGHKLGGLQSVLPGSRPGGGGGFHENLEPDCIPMIGYNDINSPPTLRVPTQPWRAGLGGVPNGRGRLRYPSESLGARPRYQDPEEDVDYLLEDKRTSRTGYIKYNSLSAAKY